MISLSEKLTNETMVQSINFETPTQLPLQIEMHQILYIIAMFMMFCYLIYENLVIFAAVIYFIHIYRYHSFALQDNLDPNRFDINHSIDLYKFGKPCQIQKLSEVSECRSKPRGSSEVPSCYCLQLQFIKVLVDEPEQGWCLLYSWWGVSTSTVIFTHKGIILRNGLLPHGFQTW